MMTKVLFCCGEGSPPPPQKDRTGLETSRSFGKGRGPTPGLIFEDEGTSQSGLSVVGFFLMQTCQSCLKKPSGTTLSHSGLYA